MDGFTAVGIKVGAMVFTFYCQQPVAGAYTCYEPTHGYTYADSVPLTQTSFSAYNQRMTADFAKEDACRKRGWHWWFGHLPGGGSGNYCAP